MCVVVHNAGARAGLAGRSAPHGLRGGDGGLRDAASSERRLLLESEQALQGGSSDAHSRAARSLRGSTWSRARAAWTVRSPGFGERVRVARPSVVARAVEGDARAN